MRIRTILAATALAGAALVVSAGAASADVVVPVAVPVEVNAPIPVNVPVPVNAPIVPINVPLGSDGSGLDSSMLLGDLGIG